MHHSHRSSPQWVVQWLLPILPCIFLSSLPDHGQESASEGTVFRGNHAEIAVTVRDSSGEPISGPAMIRLYRAGGIPAGEMAASKGRAFFILQSLGDYTVVVEASGF